MYLEEPAELLAIQWYSPDIDEETDVKTKDPPRVHDVPVETKRRDPLYHLRIKKTNVTKYSNNRPIKFLT